MESLQARLADEALEVRESAAATLLRLGDGGDTVYQIIVQSIADNDPGTVSQSMEAVDALVAESGERSTSFLTMLVRNDVARANFFGQVGWDTRTTANSGLNVRISTLVHLMSNADAVVKGFAAARLESLDRFSFPYFSGPLGFPGLLGGLRNRVRSPLQNGNQELLDGLEDALGDLMQPVRYAAAYHLALLDYRSERLDSVLAQMLRDGADTQRVVAATMLIESRPDESEAVAVEVLSHSTDWIVKMEAASVLGRVGRPDDGAVQALFDGLLDEDNDVREGCARAIAAIAKRSPKHAPAIESRMVAALDDPAFAAVDSIEHRSGNDYAFDALWFCMAGEGVISGRVVNAWRSGRECRYQRRECGLVARLSSCSAIGATKTCIGHRQTQDPSYLTYLAYYGE